jgi:hypothetical protein
VARKLDTYELNGHLREIEQVTELVQGMFDLELKVGNLDEVSDRWWLLYELTSDLKCKDVYCTLVDNLWADDGVREVVTIAKIFGECQAPYPSDAVRLFKSKAAKRLRHKYTKIMNKLRKTAASIHYLKGMKQQAVAIIISGICAIFIGLANFASRILFNVVSPGLGLTDLNEEQPATRMLAVDFGVQQEGEFYEPIHVDESMGHAAGSKTDTAVLDVLMKMLEQLQENHQEQHENYQEQQLQIAEMTRQQRVQHLELLQHNEEFASQNQGQWELLASTMTLQSQEQQLQLAALMQQTVKLTWQQQEQHFELLQHNEEFASQNQGQWELLASIESAVVPVCLDAAADSMFEEKL